jgi:large subunit ribosomal protein L15e
LETASQVSPEPVDTSAETREWMNKAAITWRRDPVIKRLTSPTSPLRARRLGYKNRRGTIVVRVRIRRGGARKPRPVSGRRQKAMGISKFTRSISLKHIAEGRVERRYPNLKVKSSYYLFSDGKNHWFEVILGKTASPSGI